MPARNRASIMGYLGQDPESNTTNSGKLVVNLSVATTEKWKDDKGEWKEQTEWHRVVVWPPFSDACAKYLHKGSLVDVEGPLRTRQWEDKEGTTRSTTEIVARQILFLDRKEGGAPSQRDNSQPAPKEDGFPF
jgi:single-strand DNA-binding protein